MVDINLHQAAEKDLMISKRKSVLSSTYFISLVLLVVVGSFYGLTMLYKNRLASQKDALASSKEQEVSSLDQRELNNLNDFQDRLTSSNFNLNNKKNPEDIFQLVEKLIVKGSYLNSLVFSSVDNKIEIEVVADSFRLAANQILSLKKSELFSDVKITDSSRNQDGQAVFKLEAIFNINDKS